MIDKKKLIEKFKELELPHSASIIENFPEEPDIDFDAIYAEWVNVDDTTSSASYNNFLKSKHLSAPTVDMDQLRNEVYSQIVKPKQLPVKKTWTLKKEYLEFCKYFELYISGISTTLNNVDPFPHLKQYYDLTETQDYSVVKKESVVEVNTKDGRTLYGCIHKIDEFVQCYDSEGVHINKICKTDEIKSLTILKAAG